MNTTNGMTIAEAARVTVVTADAIRHYVRIGLLNPKRGKNGYRRLREQDVRRIRFIRRSQRLGFKLDEIRAVIHESAHGNTPCPLVRDILRRRVMDNKKALEEMLTLQNRTEQNRIEWKRHSKYGWVCKMTYPRERLSAPSSNPWMKPDRSIRIQVGNHY